MKFFADNEDYKKSLLSTASAPGRPEAVPPEQWMSNAVRRVTELVQCECGGALTVDPYRAEAELRECYAPVAQAHAQELADKQAVLDETVRMKLEYADLMRSYSSRAIAAEAILTAEKEAHAQELAKLKPCSDEDCELKLQRYYTFMDALGVVREPINERNEIVWINARAVAAEAARDRQYEFNIGQIAKLAAAEAALTAAKARIEELEGILGDAHLLAKSTEAALEELLGEDNV